MAAAPAATVATVTMEVVGRTMSATTATETGAAASIAARGSAGEDVAISLMMKMTILMIYPTILAVVTMELAKLTAASRTN